MRTTVTLDEDVAIALQQLARERGLSFKQALNSTVRTGLRGQRAADVDYRVPARSLGLRPNIDLDKAMRLAAELEDDELVRKLDMRK